MEEVNIFGIEVERKEIYSVQDGANMLSKLSNKKRKLL
jgi:hypothetical protein